MKPERQSNDIFSCNSCTLASTHLTLLNVLESEPSDRSCSRTHSLISRQSSVLR
jgi:hypothetical protein